MKYDMKILLLAVTIVSFGFPIFAQSPVITQKDIAELPINGIRDKPKIKKLHQVKRIYLGRIVGDHDEELPIQPLLVRDLEKHGFAVVDNSGAADATLTGSILSELPLDGDGPVQPRFIEKFKLTSTNAEALWLGTTKFSAAWHNPDRLQIAASKIVRRLFDDWMRSAKRAGMKP